LKQSVNAKGLEGDGFSAGWNHSTRFFMVTTCLFCMNGPSDCNISFLRKKQILSDGTTSHFIFSRNQRREVTLG